jgi:hypothetical protein
MKSLFSLICVFLIFAGAKEISAQQIEIYGKVINKETKEVIPFANIAIKDVYKGTASNILGEFSFKVDSLPMELVVTHLSYDSREILVTQSEELVIELTPGKLIMAEVVIEGAGNRQFAYKLVSNAYYKITTKGRSQRYGKAFYRQISKNGDEYSELYEIFYDTRYSNNGVEDWAIQEGRYALKLSTVDSFIYNKNFTQMVRLLTVVQPNTEDLIMPVSELVHEQFDLATERIMSVDNRKVALISFSKKAGIPYAALEGELTIDIDSYEVLKIKGVIADDNLNFISLTGKKGAWKNYVVTCEIAFKKLDEGQLALDYMRLGQNFDYYIDEVFANTVETTSFFTYYEYYEPPKRKKLGGRLMRFNQRDSDALDAVGYNQLFWDANIIVKRTPLEATITESFERERAFGSIYLNNTNQLILEDYEVDNDPFIIQVRNQLKKYTLPIRGEKVYLHYDKPMYMAGEDLWFKAYVVNMANNSSASASDALHVCVLGPDGKALIQGIHVLEDGFGAGKIKIPASWAAGEYQVIAFTDWMRNFNPRHFYRQHIIVLNADNQSNEITMALKDSLNTFRLFPEGGGVVQDIPAQLGFVAQNRFGHTIDLKGRLLNHEGRQVASIKSEYEGFGSFFALPQKDLDYKIMIMSDEFEADSFPEVQDRGYATMINNLKPNTIDITVRGTPELEGKKFYLLVISNGVLFDRRIGALTRGLYKAEIPKTNLPSGMAQILLVDEVGKIQSKRLVFLNQPKSATVKYYLPKKEFKSRERIDMVLEVNDENGKSMGFSNISVSVVDKDKISRKQSASNIRSHFTFDYLLDYDLDNAGSLFEDFDRETLKKLDYVMLSQNTILPDISTLERFEEGIDIDIPRSKNLSLVGSAVAVSDGKPLVNGYLSIISRSGVQAGSWHVRADENGEFILSGLTITDSTLVDVVALDANRKPVPVNLVFKPSLDATYFSIIGTTANPMDSETKKYFNEMKKVSSDIPGTNAAGASSIDVAFMYDAVQPFGKPSQSISIDQKYEQYSNLKQLFQSRLPGTAIENEQLRIRGRQGIPIYLLDGMVLNWLGEGTLSEVSQPNEILSTIAVADVEKIDIIKDVGIRIFGRDCSAGIVAVYSKGAAYKSKVFADVGATQAWLPGYQLPTVFESPNYASREVGDRTDNRTTLYWNPGVKTNRKGRAKISFYNSDRARNMQICVEGITQDGVPIFDLYDFGRSYSKSRKNQ